MHPSCSLRMTYISRHICCVDGMSPVRTKGGTWRLGMALCFTLLGKGREGSAGSGVQTNKQNSTWKALWVSARSWDHPWKHRKVSRMGLSTVSNGFKRWKLWYLS